MGECAIHSPGAFPKGRHWARRPYGRSNALVQSTSRERELRARLLQSNGEALTDEELLELILIRTMPSREVKSLVGHLLEEFGSLAEVLSASRARLLTRFGIHPDCLAEMKLVVVIAQRLARSKMTRREVISSWEQLMDYCRLCLARRHREEFRVLFLDACNRLIRDETIAEGTVSHVPVYPRELLGRAIELDCRALIMVHNHPGGDPQPSPEDITMTNTIVDLCAACDIVVHDHVIISRNGEFSFRKNGLLT